MLTVTTVISVTISENQFYSCAKIKFHTFKDKIVYIRDCLVYYRHYSRTIFLEEHDYTLLKYQNKHIIVNFMFDLEISTFKFLNSRAFSEKVDRKKMENNLFRVLIKHSSTGTLNFVAIISDLIMHTI